MSDRILGAACVVASAGMAWAAQGYAAAISYEPVGPRAFPLLLAALLGAGGLWLIVRPTLRGAQPYRGVPLRARWWPLPRWRPMRCCSRPWVSCSPPR